MDDPLNDAEAAKAALEFGAGGATGWRSRGSGVVFRHSARAVDGPDGGTDASNGGAESGGDAAAKKEDAKDEFRSTVVDQQDKILLPQSTHSLLFTERVCSLPFFFAIFVLFVSFACLGLALWDNLSVGYPGNPLGVPVNVSEQVRAAQFLSVLVALTMEEEIPTGSYMLRMIPRSSVREKLGVSYGKFVFSALLRLTIGYLLLLNVWLSVVQSDRVLDMFYDMLALGFLSQCDDIAFKLAKYDVLGKTLRNACAGPSFHVEFSKKPYYFRKKMTIFVKLLYIFNLLVFMGGTVAIAALQRRGRFQIGSVTVTFGEQIWEHALVEGSEQEEVLVYSYFSGVYEQEGSQTQDGRPIYREMRKFDGGKGAFEEKVPAEIKYCKSESAWVFTHPYIRKSRGGETIEDSDCPWLLRSPETDAYNLLEVSGLWEIWVGVINKNAQVLITSNLCKDNTDCNLNGQCVDQKCQCDKNSRHIGLHCELEEPCPRILGSLSDSWALMLRPDCSPLVAYGRPVYTLTNIDDEHRVGTGNDANITIGDSDEINLVYSGSRWFGAFIVDGKTMPLEFKLQFAREYHAFWDRSFDERTIIISDPTTRSYPVGVDFFLVGERGPQFGPFGVMHPLQEPPGRGMFSCVDNATSQSFGGGFLNTSCNYA
ncbi:hypothetical protein ACHAXT_011911 [Thalassiosira profunda]